MHPSAACYALIKRFEGFARTPYLCPAGYLTVGYGHVIIGTRNWGSGISEEEAHALLLKDVEIAARAVERLIASPLKQHQFDALVSFAFNLGAGALQRSTLRQVVNRGEHGCVPAELQRWVFAGGRRLPGLVKRRAGEAAMYAG